MNYANNSDPTKHFKYRDWEIGEILEKGPEKKPRTPRLEIDSRHVSQSTQQRGALIDFLEHLSLMGRVLDVRIGQDDLGYA